MSYPDLTTCEGEISDTSNAESCYNDTLDNGEKNSLLTSEAAWDIQSKVIKYLEDEEDENTSITVDDNDLGGSVTISKDGGKGSDKFSTKQWRNMKLVKAFTQEYNTWKNQERDAIQDAIDEYQQRITAVTSKVDSLINNLDKMEADTVNNAKQEHMLSELSSMLSTYDRKIEVNQRDGDNTDKTFKKYLLVVIIFTVAIALCSVLYYYQKKRL